MASKRAVALAATRRIEHMSAAQDSNRPYVTITADTHAGASMAAYREYLDPKSSSPQLKQTP